MPMAGGLDQLERFMASIRRLESGSYAGNYQAQSPHNPGWGTAKGAYQIIDATWNGYGGYATALAAPSSVQDEWARQQFTRLYQQYGNWEDVASVHFSGQPLANNQSGPDLYGTTVPGYITTITGYYDSPDNPGFDPEYVSQNPGDATVPPVDGPAATEDFYPPGGILLEDGDNYVLRYRVAPGVFMEWVVTDEEALRRSGYRTRRARDYDDPEVRGNREGQHVVGWQESGDAAELAPLEAQGMSVEEFFEQTVLQYLSPFHPARDDPEVLAVMARVAANPDVGEATIQGWLRETEFWANQSNQTNAWNDMSPAERDMQIDDMAFRLQQDYFQIVGARIDMDHSELRRWAEEVASGQRTYGQVISEVQDFASQYEESPYSRATRSEVLAQRQFGIDTENQAQQLRDIALRWGIDLPQGELDRWANAIMMNENSMADFEQSMETQARTMYPGLPEGMDTTEWARPWMMTLSRVLETGTPDVLDDRIQSALASGTTVYEFERQLQLSDEWMGTGNARDTFENVLSQVSRQMGFE